MVLRTEMRVAAAPVFLYYFLPLSLLLVVALEGWWFEGDNGKLFTNLFSIAIVFFLIFKTTFSFFSLIVAFLCSIVVAVSVVTNLQIGSFGFYRDFLLFFKLLVFSYVVYRFFYDSPFRGNVAFLRKISFLCWLLITVSIVFSYFTGYGLQTYEEFGVGSKFYFPSVNELNFVYFVSVLMACFFFKSLAFRILFLAVGFLIYLAIGNKSFLALYFIAGCSLFFLYSSIFLRVLICFSVFFFLMVLVVFPSVFELLFGFVFSILSFVFGGLSGGGEKFLIKASYLSPFSALVSERDVLYLIGHDIFFSGLDSIRLLFGLSYGAYGSLYAEKRGGEFSFSEIDPVDLFFSYGLLGFFVFSFVLFRLFYKGADTYSKPRSTLILLFFFAGLMTGHIYGYVFPLFFFSMYLGLLNPRVS